MNKKNESPKYNTRLSEDHLRVFRGISDAVVEDAETLPKSGRRYVTGLYWGRGNDYTVIVIIDEQTHHIVGIDRFKGQGWSLQKGRVKEMFENWKPEVIWAEINSIGLLNSEALQMEGLPLRTYKTTNQSIAPLIESLALAVERTDIGLLNDPILLSELGSYRIEPLTHGRFRFGPSPGTTDNTVIATALAWYGVRQSGIRLEFV